MQPVILKARINNSEEGMSAATHSMAASLALVNVHSDNIAFSAIPGYQSKRPVMRPFVEFLGANAVQSSTSEEVGRLRKSGFAYDLALASDGYFQRMDPKNGQIELTRDGRTMVDKEGFLRGVNGAFFLEQSGQPIKFDVVPSDFNKQVKINKQGQITYYNPKLQKAENIGTLSVVNSAGDPVSKLEVHQGFVEESNVYIAREFAGIVPLRRDFEANRQLFQIQSGNLQKMIQDLGRVQ